MNTAPIKLSPVVNDINHPSWDPLFRITVEQYHEMIDNGILGPEDQVELLEGLLVRKMPTNPPHSLSKGLLKDLLVLLLASEYFVREQDPTTTDDSEPEPDISAVRGKRRDYENRHPSAADTAMLVEVSDSSLQRDREKKRVYARAGYPRYWIVNISDRQIEVYTQPSGQCTQPDYALVTIYKEGESVPVVIDGKDLGRIAVKEVLP